MIATARDRVIAWHNDLCRREQAELIASQRARLDRIFSGDPGPQDTPPCLSLPPADPERFPRAGHDE